MSSVDSYLVIKKLNTLGFLLDNHDSKTAFLIPKVKINSVHNKHSLTANISII